MDSVDIYTLIGHARTSMDTVDMLCVLVDVMRYATTPGSDTETTSGCQGVGWFYAP